VQRNFATAREWLLKSLAISEEQDAVYAAITYNQLGRIALEEQDFATAREWYLKSLAISEKRGILHGAGSTYSQLGRLAARQSDFEDAGKWFARAINAFEQTRDRRGVEQVIETFLLFYQRASRGEKERLKAIWLETGRGPFPSEREP
jgi:tetratricopeptide (TPR) repeat protein